MHFKVVDPGLKVNYVPDAVELKVLLSIWEKN